MKERAHRADEFLGFGGESGTEAYHTIYTDDQDPRPEDLVVIINPQGKVLCTMDDPFAFREQTKELQTRGLLQVLRVSRVTYR